MSDGSDDASLDGGEDSMVDDDDDEEEPDVGENSKPLFLYYNR